ncbi:MAG TPA: hypothetical protein VHW00_05970 [Thermoanaerobaculia bacterium]|nr:hypothetical protein [Thermoanaerobaculia bacterium]
MKKNILLTIIVLALVFGGALQSQERAISEANTAESLVTVKSLSGKVIERQDTGITVSTAAVRPITIHVRTGAQTKVLLNGTASTLSRIQTGDSVVIQYSERAATTISSRPVSETYAATIDALTVEVHRHRAGKIEVVLEPLPPPAGYAYCPNVGSGGTIPASKTPCYCNACGGAGSGMVW